MCKTRGGVSYFRKKIIKVVVVWFILGAVKLRVKKVSSFEGR